MAARGTPKKPFLGHKGEHFLCKWEGVDWAGNFCDKMHDYKLICEMTLKCLVGNRSHQGIGLLKKRMLGTGKIAKLTAYSVHFTLPTSLLRGD